jgi:hypothetical protein
VTSVFQPVGKQPLLTPSVQRASCTPYHGRVGTDSSVPAGVPAPGVLGTSIGIGSGEDAGTTWSTDTSKWLPSPVHFLELVLLISGVPGIFLGDKGRLARKADNFNAICGRLHVSQPYGPSRPVTGIALRFLRV